MSYFPRALDMAARKLSGYNTKTIRLETTSGDTSGPNRSVTVNLPENALLDMKSLAFHFDVAASGSGT